MRDSKLARLIGNGHRDATISRQLESKGIDRMNEKITAEIRKTIQAILVSERLRKSSWLALAELLDCYPAEAKSCSSELRAMQAEVETIEPS